eukprot:TRINITY_DN46992_c0_g1_i1.p1 TRINITY_DN46992_c0_g1~~TRINITY_DN46992_c0_g1_i1.p1  ORF type:complete len:685 (+),score=102.13 TRINITY_DN46992_c0_g1_i1:75-2057(+)
MERPLELRNAAPVIVRVGGRSSVHHGKPDYPTRRKRPSGSPTRRRLSPRPPGSARPWPQSLPDVVRVQHPKRRPHSAPHPVLSSPMAASPPSHIPLFQPAPPEARSVASSSAWAWSVCPPESSGPSAKAATIGSPEQLSPPTQPGDSPRRKRRGKNARIRPLPGMRCSQCKRRLASVRLCPTAGTRHTAVGLSVPQSTRISALFGQSWQANQAPQSKRKQLCRAPPLFSLAVVQKGTRREQSVASLFVDSWDKHHGPMKDLMDEMLGGLIFPPKDTHPGETLPDPVVLLSRISALVRESIGLVHTRGGSMGLLTSLFLSMEGPDIDRVLLHKLAVGKFWDTGPAMEVWQEYTKRHRNSRNQSVYRELQGGMSKCVEMISEGKDVPPIDPKWSRMTVLIAALSAPISPPQDVYLRIGEGWQSLRAQGCRAGTSLLWVVPCIFTRDLERCAAASLPKADGGRAQRQAESGDTLLVVRGLREGIDLSTMSMYPLEREVLIPPLTVLKVVSVTGGVVETVCEGRATARTPSLHRVCDLAIRDAELINKELEAAAIFERAAVREQHRSTGALVADVERRKNTAAYSYLGPPDSVWIRLDTGVCITRKGAPCLGAELFSAYGTDVKRHSQNRRISRFRKEFRAAAAAEEDMDDIRDEMSEVSETSG